MFFLPKIYCTLSYCCQQLKKVFPYISTNNFLTPLKCNVRQTTHIRYGKIETTQESFKFHGSDSTNVLLLSSLMFDSIFQIVI